MTQYHIAISEPDSREPEEFRFYVSGRNVKIQWSIIYSGKSGVRDTQNIALDAWFDEQWLDAYGLTDHKGDTFSIDTAREMWNYLYARHSADAKRKRKANA